MSSDMTYQIATVLSDPVEKELNDKIVQVVDVNIVSTSPNKKVEIYKSDKFSGFKENGVDKSGSKIILADSEEYKKQIKRISKLFIKRLFKYGVIRR
jgi:hypothetical protein